MARCQRVTAGDQVTWTVVDDDGRVVEPVEEFLEFGRQSGFSANTVRSYATALALWASHLGLHGRQWDRVEVRDLAQFAGAVRHGTVGRLDVSGRAVVAESTVAARVRPVLSFYRFQESTGRLTAAGSLFHWVPWRPGRRYLPLLEHVHRRTGRQEPILRVRVPAREVPVLDPAPVRDLVEAEAHYIPDTATWDGDLRYRLLWSLLMETGLRLGEALCLQHRDWETGRGDTASVRVVPRPHPFGLVPKSGRRRVFIGSTLDRLYGDYVWWLCDRGADAAVADWDAAYIFCNVYRPPLFGPLRPESVYSHLAAMKRRVPALPQAMTPHWFRHTHATALLLAGTPLHVVSRRLGHRSVQTTTDTYAHVTADAEMAALTDWARLAARWGVDDAHHDR